MPKFSRFGEDSNLMMGSSRVEENAFKDYLLFNTVIELRLIPKKKSAQSRRCRIAQGLL